jgi:hypothetical protein
MDLRVALGGYVLFLAFLVYVCVLADPNSDSLGEFAPVETAPGLCVTCGLTCLVVAQEGRPTSC